MYCILVTGIPAAGKSTMAAFLGERLDLPVLSKDRIKELLYDTVGFRSREEKVRLGHAAMEILYYAAEQLMVRSQAFILENNFENSSRAGLTEILERHGYRALTIAMTGDHETIYRRFLTRDQSPDRHRGHVVNDRYPETDGGGAPPVISLEDFTGGIIARGMDTFSVGGPRITVDTTDLSKVDYSALLKEVQGILAEDGSVPSGGGGR